MHVQTFSFQIWGGVQSWHGSMHWQRHKFVSQYWFGGQTAIYGQAHLQRAEFQTKGATHLAASVASHGNGTATPVSKTAAVEKSLKN